MKKNLIPLLGIALVVAILSTGVFYGLFAGKLSDSASDLPKQTILVAAHSVPRGATLKAEDVRTSELRGQRLKAAYTSPGQVAGLSAVAPLQENEPLTVSNVASRESSAVSVSGVPSGMRAVSIRVGESAGVLALLHGASNKVDLQAVSDRHGEAELRTILENVEVLAVIPPAETPQNAKPNTTVVTILAKPADADLVALADSGARIRLLLRNPLDTDDQRRQGIQLASLFGASRENPGPFLQASRRQPPAPARMPAALSIPDVRYSVRLVGATAAGRSALQSELQGSGPVTKFRASARPEELIRSLESRKELDVLSTSEIATGPAHARSVEAGVGDCHLRVRFSSQLADAGKLSVRFQPELTWRNGRAVNSRRLEGTATLSDSDSVLIAGLLEQGDTQDLLNRLFPGHAQTGRDLLIVVTPQTAPLRAALLTRVR